VTRSRPTAFAATARVVVYAGLIGGEPGAGVRGFSRLPKGD